MNTPINKSYWDTRYTTQDTNWDLGSISTPLKAYIDQLDDKHMAILIPGCGNAWEAEYLLQQGFTNITLVDISPVLVSSLQQKFAEANGPELNIICGDFFELNTTYDLVLEQTFFCALDPGMRQSYVDKMYSLLRPGGKLVGLLFNRSFDGGPPFGGSKEEYVQLFEKKFKIKTMEACYNSINPRAGTELFFIAGLGGS